MYMYLITLSAGAANASVAFYVTNEKKISTLVEEESNYAWIWTPCMSKILLIVRMTVLR